MPIRLRVGDAGGGPADHPEAGYMLIEVVATLVITLMLLAFAYPSVPAGTSPTKFLALASATASLLRDARTAAVRQGAVVPAVFDAATRTLRSGATVVAIPLDVTMSLDAGGNCPADGRAAAILFRPDGTNCGGILRLAKGRHSIRARVNWVDGRIDLVDGA